MLRHYYRLAIVVVCGVAAAAAALLADATLPSDGLAFDLAARVRAGWAVVSEPAADAAVALVLLDDRTLASDEFAPLPRTFLAPYWADMLDALDAAGAAAVGFDIIFEYTPNLFRADFDQPFLAALDRHKSKLVLGRSAQTTVALPYHYASGANADELSLALVEMGPDDDGVFRRLAAHYADDDGVAHPTLVAALARRAGWPEMPADALAAPWGPLELTLPAYSMVDVLRCADRPDILRRAFAGKVVLVGSALPEEDRKAAADRLFPIPPGHLASRAGAADEGCRLAQAGVTNPLSRTVPGVFVHALIADAVARGRTLTVLPAWINAGTTAALAMAGAVLGFALAPLAATAAVAAGIGAFYLADVALLSLGLWMPPSFAILGVLVSLAVAYAARYLFEERRRRQVQNAFNHYLSPMIVERLAGGSKLELGGETRDVSVMFADLSGFTALSGKVGPEKLMELTNRYLAYIVEAVEATGGYVDKFIGDAVMAMWGAPAADGDHAGNAVASALTAAARVAHARAADQRDGLAGFSVKIGIASGPATVGNVGTLRRFNYTAIGETVNIASRLEGLPGTYGCRIVVGEDTARRVRERFLLCELDRVRVKGKAQPLTIFEVVAALEAADDARHRYVALYGEALQLYRGGRFAEAAARWRDLRHPDSVDGEDGPAQVMAARARDYAAHPPAADWDGVWSAPKK